MRNLYLFIFIKSFWQFGNLTHGSRKITPEPENETVSPSEISMRDYI